METIVFNSSNLINYGKGNNTFVYRFPSSIHFKNNQVAVSSVSLYYSWYNISALLGNNAFTYSWCSGTTTTTYQVVLMDGIWEINTINEFLQFQMIQNGTYLIYTDPITGLTNNKYYIEFLVSPTLYGINRNLQRSRISSKHHSRIF